MSKYIRKYFPGEKYNSILPLTRDILNHHWIYIGHKAYHPGWILNFHLSLILRYLKQGVLFRALKDGEYKERDKQKKSNTTKVFPWPHCKNVFTPFDNGGEK